MVGEISVKDSSRSQNIPLNALMSFKGSKSSIEISGIPDLIGTWKVKDIYVHVLYPDGSTHQILSKKVKDNYVATIQQCNVAGRTKNGFSIQATAIDEHGTEESTFVLGVGDVVVSDYDGTIEPEVSFSFMKLFDAVPENLNKGVVVDTDGQMRYWNGTKWTWNNWLSSETSIPDKQLSGLVWKYSISEGEETISAYIEELSATESVTRFDPNVRLSELEAVSASIESDIDTKCNSVRQEIPTKVSQLQNDSSYATTSQLTSYATVQSVSDINGKIPIQATSSNKLADKDFVNSSITTATAYFRGTFNSVAQLPTSGMTVNDYAFVIRTDSIGQTFYDRYKYNGTSWLFEYSINNSGFTSVQYAAINSGITQSLVNDMVLSSSLSSVNLSGLYDDDTPFSFDILYRL